MGAGAPAQGGADGFLPGRAQARHFRAASGPNSKKNRIARVNPLNFHSDVRRRLNVATRRAIKVPRPTSPRDESQEITSKHQQHARHRCVAQSQQDACQLLYTKLAGGRSDCTWIGPPCTRKKRERKTTVHGRNPRLGIPVVWRHSTLCP